MTSAISAVFRVDDPDDRHLRITTFQREFVAVTLWILVTFVQFDGDELLLYPLALYFGVRAFQERASILGLMAQSWPIMLFPIWCLISPIWAVVPAEAFKQAVYLSLTMLICYHVVLHLSPRQIMYAVFVATGAIGLLTFVLGTSTGNYAWALFPHKNRMGISMVMLWAVALAITLDPRASKWLRLCVAPSLAALAAYLIFNSNSATAIILMAATGAVCLACTAALLGGFLRPSRIALTCLFIALVTSLGSVGLSTFKGDPVGAVLEHFGKDRTLTGRTGLWQYAEDQIEERPVLGVGGGGFWRYQASPLVQRIYSDYHKGARDHFNFHNSYYEIAVHQGLFGLGLVFIAQIWAISWLMRGAIGIGTMPHIYFLCAAATVLVRTFTEADFYKHFIVFHMLFWIGALSAMLSIKFGPVIPPEPADRSEIRSGMQPA